MESSRRTEFGDQQCRLRVDLSCMPIQIPHANREVWRSNLLYHQQNKLCRCSFRCKFIPPPIPLKVNRAGAKVHTEGKFGGLFQNLYPRKKVFDTHCTKIIEIKHRSGVSDRVCPRCGKYYPTLKVLCARTLFRHKHWRTGPRRTKIGVSRTQRGRGIASTCCRANTTT